MLGQKRPIGQLGTEYTIICDSQDVEAIRNYLGNREDCDYSHYFVKVQDGDYVEIWGSWTLIHLDSMATLLWDGSWNNFELFHADFSLVWEGLKDYLSHVLEHTSENPFPITDSANTFEVTESTRIQYLLNCHTETLKIWRDGIIVHVHQKPNETDIYFLDEIAPFFRGHYCHRRIISILKGLLS